MDKQTILEALGTVKDPEIPALSLVELGMIEAIRFDYPAYVEVEMLPTFTACPALELMRLQIHHTLKQLGFEQIRVVINREKQWSTDRLSDEAREKLRRFGLAPPPKNTKDAPLLIAQCPKCGSTNTILKNPFGPTLCRAIYFCQDCSETFEQFKPV